MVNLVIVNFYVDFILAAGINLLKIKYEFYESFDLFCVIKALPTDIALHDQMVHNSPRISDMKSNILKLQKLSSKLQDCLLKTKAATKSYLDATLFNGFEKGYGHLMSEKKEWSVLQFNSALKAFNTICRYADVSLPKDMGGQVPHSLRKYAIFRLGAIYHAGTKKEPTCGWDDIEGHYVGDFYDFLIDVKSVLSIDLGKTNSIGKYAVEILPKYRKAFENYSMKESIFEE